eukprot:7889380-Pyramimonas_sp.AAC.1
MVRIATRVLPTNDFTVALARSKKASTPTNFSSHVFWEWQECGCPIGMCSWLWHCSGWDCRATLVVIVAAATAATAATTAATAG